MARDTEPSDNDVAELSADEAKHRQFGLKLFLAYLAVYVGFIALSTLYHETLSSPAMFGMNLAVVYGFGLILLAFVLAMIYLFSASRDVPSVDSARKEK